MNKKINYLYYILFILLYACTSPDKENYAKTQEEEPQLSWEEEMERIKTVAQEHPTSFEAFMVACSARMSGDISPCIPNYDIIKHTNIFKKLPHLENKEFSAGGKGVRYTAQGFIQSYIRMGNDSISYHCLLLFDKKGNQKDMKFFTRYVVDGSKDKLIASYVSSSDTSLVLYDYMPGEHELLMTTTDNCQKGERWIVTQEGKFKLLEEFTCPEEDR